MATVCSKCKHLMPAGEVHVCPSEAYLKVRNSLIRDAAMAEELFTIKELEQAAWIAEARLERNRSPYADAVAADLE